MGCCFSRREEDGDVKRQDTQSGCAHCCAKVRNCLMSPECGRGLQIANVCAMCGMCIGFWR